MLGRARVEYPETVASQIWTILCRHAGAACDGGYRRFASAVVDDGCQEYRFEGSLGFGGKFWNDGGPWRVTCYREDETPERLAAIEATNAALAELYRRVTGMR